MTIIEVIILGLIQGLTEFIPVSSSGHLVLVPSLASWEEHSTAFDIFLHAGTLFALIVYFSKDLIKILNFKDKKNRNLLLKIIVSTIPAGISGLLFQDFIDEHFKGLGVITFMLIFIGILMIFADKIFKKTEDKIQNLSLLKSFIIGLSQSIAFIRGTSRSGITTLTGLASKLELNESVRYSFLIGIPILAAAFLKESISLVENGIGNESFALITTGFIVSFLSGLFAIRFMMQFTKNHGLQFFGIYRIMLGLILLLTIVF